jgi:hypothetical protein
LRSRQGLGLRVGLGQLLAHLFQVLQRIDFQRSCSGPGMGLVLSAQEKSGSVKRPDYASSQRS